MLDDLQASLAGFLDVDGSDDFNGLVGENNDLVWTDDSGIGVTEFADDSDRLNGLVDDNGGLVWTVDFSSSANGKQTKCFLHKLCFKI